MALSHLGQGAEIANLDTENSEAANACRRFYELAKDETIRDVKWPWATRFAELALVEEDPTEEWAYSYRYPTDCLTIRRILSGSRNDSRQSRIPYKIVQDDSGLLVYTDLDSASIEYTVREDNPGVYPVDFVAALSYKLAWYIAPRLTKSDPFNLRKTVADSYAAAISKAARNSFNEEQDEEPVQSEFVRARE